MTWLRTTDVASLDAISRMGDVLDDAKALIERHAFISRRPTPETRDLCAYEFEVARTVQVALNHALVAMWYAAESAATLIGEMERLLERGESDAPVSS